MTDNYLSKGPLKVCLTVFRFSPIESMGQDYIPRIQDMFRKNGLPNYTDKKETEFGPMGEQKRHTQWLFSSFDRSELIVIGTSSFAYQTFDYKGFAVFKQRVFELFSLFAEIAEFYNSVVLNFFGLRYINAIESSDWKPYLSKSYHGIQFPPGLVDDSLNQYHGLYAQAITRLDEEKTANLIIKTTQNSQGIVYPPDITLLELPTITEGAMSTLLDIDHFILLDCQPEDSELLQRILDQLHDVCEKVFMQAVTETAKEEWK